MSLGIKGRFYANLSVLYLTTRFYAMNISVYSHMIDRYNYVEHIMGRFYANLIIVLND